MTISDDALIEGLTRHLEHVARQRHLPGLSVALARGGEVIWEGGFGHADLVADRPMRGDTTHPSGSMGKIITATAVMRLVERGRLALDDPINRHLDFEVTNPLGDREITVEDLLVHRSGLTSNGARCMFDEPPPLGEVLRDEFAAGDHEYYHGVLPKWSAPVGEGARYSNTGMALLGYLVQIRNPDGASFSDWVRDDIIEPLGMDSTVFPPVQSAAHVPADLWRRRSTGYAGFGPLRVRTPTIRFAEYPAGNAVTTPGDLLRLAVAHQRDGELDGVRVLRPETARAMRQNRTGGVRPHNHLDFGLMWMLHEAADEGVASRLYGDADFFAHGGAHMFGWVGRLRVYPGRDVGVCVMTNRWSLADDAGYRPPAMSVPDWINEVVAGRASLDGPARDRDWGWKVSYLAGLLVAERTVGLMGVSEPFTDAHVDEIVAGTHVADTHAHLWDPDGFRAGIDDIEAIDHTHEAITAFVRQGGPRVPTAELEALYAELGGAQLELPMRPPS